MSDNHEPVTSVEQPESRDSTSNLKKKDKKPPFLRRGGAGNTNTGEIVQDIEANNVARAALEEIQEHEEDALRIQNPILADDKIAEAAVNMPLKRIERRSADGLAEMHFIGEITSVVGVCEDLSEGVFIRWVIEVPDTWRVLSGESSGQTQVGCGGMGPGSRAVLPLNHPIDVHYAQVGLQGWGAARLSVQAYRMDSFGSKILAGYGFSHIPSLSGNHKLELSMWRPVGTPDMELAALFLGKVPALQSEKAIYDAAWQQRCRLVTIAVGRVYADIYVIERAPEADKVALGIFT